MEDGIYGEKDTGRVPVTKDMTFGGVEQIPLIAEAGPYMIAGPGQYHDQVKDLPLEQGTVLGWNHESMIEGIGVSDGPGREGNLSLPGVPGRRSGRRIPGSGRINIIHFPAADRGRAKGILDHGLSRRRLHQCLLHQ